MIRAIIFTVVGFYLSRKVYEKYDLAQRKQEQKATKRRIENYLHSIGWKESEIEKAIKSIYKEDEQ